MHDTALQMFTLQPEKGFRSRKGLEIVHRTEPSVCLTSVYLMLHEIIACDDCIWIEIYSMETLKIGYLQG